MAYPNTTSQSLHTLKINKVPNEGTFVKMQEDNLVNANELYLVEGNGNINVESVLLVTASVDANDNITADYTYTEIDTAFNAGKTVLVKLGNNILHMTNQSEGNTIDHLPASYSFSSFMADPWNVAIFESTLSVDDTNTWSGSFPYYTIPTNTSDLNNDSGFLTSFTETDPTVPSWAKESTKPTYTASEVGAAASSHTHGNITNSGDITASATIANGDRLVINDESVSKITNSSITFGTSTSQYLANNGTWQNIPNKVSELDNDSNFTSNEGTVTSVRIQATSPVVANPSTASSTTLNTTISLADGYGDTKNPYASKTKNYVLAAPSSGNGLPDFRALTADDIPSLTKSKISDFPTIPKDIMYVTFTLTVDNNDDWVVSNVSKTFSEIYTHLSTGGTVVAVDNNHEYYYLKSYSANSIDFCSSTSGIDSSDQWLNTGNFLWIYNDNTTSYTDCSTTYLPKIYVNGIEEVFPSFYAPTTAGTSGQVLKSNGSNSAPTWTTLTIPSAVTESTVSGWGFTKNTGTITGVSVNGTSVATSGVANITSMPASILSGAIPSAVTATTQGSSDNSTKIATTAFVKTAISGFSTTDEKVKLTSQSTSGTYPIIFGPTSITSNSTYQGYYDTGITINPSTDTITATNFAGNATTATTATKLGTTTIGSASVPVYLNDGVPTPVSLEDLREDMGITNPITFWGITTDELSTGNTSTSLTGLSGTAQNGYVVIDGNGVQYIWGTVNNVAQWNQLGTGVAYKIVQSVITSPTASGNTTAFIDTISQDANGVITATKKNLNTSGTWSGNATTATTASKLGSATLGSTTKPIYLNSGTATECSTYAGGTAVTLNNTGKGGLTASFYAPTDGGTANYVLWANGTTSAPTWKEPKDALNYMINQLGTGSSTLTSNDYVITQYVGGGTTTTTYHRRPASAIRVGGLLTARKLKVALGSTTDATFDGTADQTSIPISGTLGISNGGTGATTAKVARENLGAAPSPFVAGTQTAATNVWTGDLPSNVTEYYHGLTIDYFLPYAGTSTAATLNLGGLGAKPVYVGNAATTAVTTHFPVNSVLHLTYIVNSALNSGNGCWKVSAYQNSTYYYESCYVTTGAGTAAKVGTLSNYALQPGYLQVAIYNANTAASALTLNINSTGAKPIYINGTASSSSNYTLPKGMYFVYYNGTNFYFRTDGMIQGKIQSAVQDGSGNNIASTYQTKHKPVIVTIAVADWSNSACTKTVTGVTASNTVFVSPAPGSLSTYGEAGVYCSEQAANSLTFVCTATPTASLSVNVVIFD